MTSTQMAIPSFKDTTMPAKGRTAAATIRASVAAEFRREELDPKKRDTFEEVTEYLMPAGNSGNTQMDHGFAARIIDDKLHLTKQYPDLTISMLWGHVQFVLSRRGYDFKNGRLIGYTPPDDSVKLQSVPNI